MKKILFYIATIFFGLLIFSVNSVGVEAKEVLATKELNTIVGETIGTITIYDNGEVVIGYKYGMRKATIYYCENGEGCDNNDYYVLDVMESSSSEPYKNTNSTLKNFVYSSRLEKGKEYGIKVDVYFGVNSGYKGNESIYGSPSISSVQSLKTTRGYVKIVENGGYGDEKIGDLMVKIQAIVNTTVLPILYACIGMFLVIKGAILGVQIVKSADDPNVRVEKVRALKWLVIGVGIAFAASTFVGLITGFFDNAFN